MTSGEFIIDRWMEGMIADICRVNGISHQTFSNGWVHLLEKNGVVRTICGYKTDLNSAGGSEIASDKVACFEILASQGVKAVSHTLLRMHPSDGSFTWYHPPVKDMVVKPLDGTGGRHVHRFDTQDGVESWCSRQQGIFAWAVSPFYDIKREIRMIMCDNQVLLSYAKLKPMSDGEGLPFFNLGHGATAEDIVASELHTTLARGSMKALGLRLAAVDLIETMSGETQVLEVNSGFMMEHYMRSSPARQQKGYELYEKIITTMMGIGHFQRPRESGK